MSRRAIKILLFILLFSFPWLAFTQPSSGKDQISLTVFYPTKGTVKNIQALRERGFLNIPNLKIIGVYHIKEVSDYQEAKKYVEDNRIDWFTFHPVAAEISEKNIFQKNDCTPEFVEIVNNSDGIIFFGGPDIPASIYDEKTNQLTLIEDPCRHYFEISAVFHLLGGFKDQNFQPMIENNPELPVLGICLGAQSMNVGTGGTLFQDIWLEVYGKKYVEDIIKLGTDCWHSNPFIKLYPNENLTAYNFHWIKLVPDGFFVKVLGFSEKDRPRILSVHHQAINKLGKGFKVVATSPDGKIVEAIHHTRYPNVLGIQFHPESYRLWDEDLQIRQNPEDTPFSYWEILKNNPPSLDFHRKIWDWFAEAMKKNHDRLKAKCT
jgi:putative glutamine amidotransferase